MKICFFHQDISCSVNQNMQPEKDAVYYAKKIIECSNSGNPQQVAKYTQKISEIPACNNIVHHINKIADIQKKEEEEGEEVKRYALFPILDEHSYEFLVKQELTHWSDSEMDFVADRKHYDESDARTKKLVDTILAFFLVGDGAISRNIIFRFLLECKTFEEQAMFVSQLHIELVHAMTYGMAAFTLKRDGESIAELVESAQNTPCVKAKIDFMETWMLSDSPRYKRLVAFACAEGIFFCTLFATLFWFRGKGKFPNLIFSNELIANDESLHRDWGAHLFHMEVEEILSQYKKGSMEYNLKAKEISEETHKIITQAVFVEEQFVDYILPENIEDLNAPDMKTYARLISDSLLCQLRYSPIYNVKNPFTWMDDISMEQKGNFYEVRIGAYKKKSLADVTNWKKRAGLDEELGSVYISPEEVDF